MFERSLCSANLIETGRFFFCFAATTIRYFLFNAYHVTNRHNRFIFMLVMFFQLFVQFQSASFLNRRLVFDEFSRSYLWFSEHYAFGGGGSGCIVVAFAFAFAFPFVSFVFIAYSTKNGWYDVGWDRNLYNKIDFFQTYLRSVSKIHRFHF